jgi:hypothetical protein
MSRSLLAAFLLALATSAVADSFKDLTFNPPALDSHTALTAIVSGTSPGVCVPLRGTASLSAATITLVVAPAPPLPCAAVPTTWSVPLFIGTLAPGKYDVVTMFSDVELDRRSIVIADADPPIRIEENVGLTRGGGAVGIRFRQEYLLPSLLEAAVTFDDVPATVLTAASDHLLVSPPKHAAGPSTVRLSIPNGPTYTAVGGYRYVDVVAPPDRAAYEAILIPLVFSGDGALQSFWTTELWVHNDNPHEVTQFNGPFTVRSCIIGPCLQPLEPHYTLKFDYPLTYSPFPHGRVMYVPRASAAGLHFDLRIRDLNRQGDTHGVGIPIVRERDLRAASFSLLNVPSDGQYRSRLRIYSLDAPTGAVTVRLFTMNRFPFVEVGSTTAFLSDPNPDTPAYSEVDLDPLIHAAAQPGPYRVQIDLPFLTPSPSYWAFVSVTNNQTSNVTVVTPQ